MERVCSFPSMYALVMLCVSTVLAEVRHNYFHMDSGYENLLPAGGIMWNFSVSSIVMCTLMCLPKTNCVSVFYKDGQCIGWNARIDDLSPTTPTDDFRYYEMRGIYGNVAKGKPATQSSTFPPLQGTYMASKAVDGRRYPVAFQPDDSCSCTNKFSLEWWQVDLQDTFLIKEIAVLKRVDDLFGITLVNVSIDVALVTTGPYSHCYNTGPTNSVTRFETFTCQSPIYGRYVKLSKLVKTYHCLCEVEIYVLA